MAATMATGPATGFRGFTVIPEADGRGFHTHRFVNHARGVYFTSADVATMPADSYPVRIYFAWMDERRAAL